MTALDTPSAAPLLLENAAVADGCPCNSPRGINHGIVPKETCTCAACDPEQTGASRNRPLPEIPSVLT